jgi:hypothetical protein
MNPNMNQIVNPSTVKLSNTTCWIAVTMRLNTNKI